MERAASTIDPEGITLVGSRCFTHESLPSRSTITCVCRFAVLIISNEYAVAIRQRFIEQTFIDAFFYNISVYPTTGKISDYFETRLRLLWQKNLSGCIDLQLFPPALITTHFSPLHGSHSQPA